MSIFIGDKNKRVELAERKDAINPNLFTGSKDFTGDWLHLIQVTQKDKYLDFTAVYDDWGWNGISQYIDANAGETFTFSAYIKAKAGSTFYPYPGLNTDGENGHKEADASTNSVSITTTGDWQRVSFTLTVASDGAIKPRIERGDDDAPFWIAGMKLEHGSVATPWCPAYDDYASNSNFNTLQNNVYTKPEVDSKTSGNVVTAYDVASKKPTTVTNSYTSEELVDQGALSQFADQINQLKGRQTIDSPDFNTLTDTGVYYISNPGNGKNYPTGAYGVLTVLNASNNGDTRIMQIYAPDSGHTLFVRTPYNSGGTTFTNDWNQIAWQSDITNLQNTVNNIDSTRTPIVNGANGDDLFAFETNQIRLYDGNGQTCKNLPPAAKTDYFTVQYVFEGPNNNGVAIYRSPDNEIWIAGCNGASYTCGWTRVANVNDLTNLQNTINQQSQTIQSLTTRLTNAENEISYIKANYIEGKQFPASQEAQATAWENANPQGIAFITSN